MTLEERIEAAKQALDEQPPLMPVTDDVMTVLTAAFPELFSDPPTGWIAPVGRDVRAFAQEVQHGDEAHRKWLLNAAEDFLNGRPVVPVTP